MLLLHIAAGLLALIAGAMALLAHKGGTWHRRSGTIFACAMLVMSSTGALMSALIGERISVIAGVLTFYLVSTGWLTLRRPLAQSRGIVTAFMLVAVAVAAAGFAIGIEMSGNAKTARWAPMFFVFGSVALIAAALDVRLLIAGAIQGAHRLARHLWRMGFALFIANASFFLGQAKLLPPQWRYFGLLALPVITVLLVTLYWLVRVHWKRPAVTRNPAVT